jgi:hypothetical protein
MNYPFHFLVIESNFVDFLLWSSIYKLLHVELDGASFDFDPRDRAVEIVQFVLLLIPACIKSTLDVHI